MIKRLVKKSESYVPQIGDMVIFKSHPYDFEAYKITTILPDGNLFIENNNRAYSNINPKSIKLLK